MRGWSSARTATTVATDRKRQVIPQVTYVDPQGNVTVFNSTETKVTPAELAHGEHKVMDCLDCHNRPAHTFQLPDAAMNQALVGQSISADLPYIKKKALLAIKANYPDRDTARKRIAEALRSFYQTNYPKIVASQDAKLESSIRGVQAVYLHNIFPQMKVTWGTYSNDLEHTDSPGCFRCHDGNHVSANGKTIPNDCDTCHDLLAVDEKNPKILGDLGIK